MNIVEPNFYSEFHCTHSACEDTCCSGMGVVIDKPTFDKYQRVDDPSLKKIIQLSVIPNSSSNHPATFAMLKSENGNCPFLDSQRLCSIQTTLGEGFLSRTCDTYPRAYSRVDDYLQRSLYLSCPEAARLILQRPAGIKFLEIGESGGVKYTEFPSVDTSDYLFDSKPYQHFSLVRQFSIDLLQNRSLPIWERLVILGMYCGQVSQIPEEEFEKAIPLLTRSFEDHLSQGSFAPTLQGVSSNPNLLLNVVISSLEDRIASDFTSDRFLSCYRQFITGIGFYAGIDTQDLVDQYVKASVSRYEPFIQGREYLWENYLVSKAYKDLFPFGPQKSIYTVKRTLYQEYLLLVIQFVFVRTLVIGTSGVAGQELTQDDFIRIVQSFARTVEHNPPYLEKILRSFEQGKISELPNVVSLIKP